MGYVQMEFTLPNGEPWMKKVKVLDGPKVPCPDCGEMKSARDLRESIWGACNECEADRIHDVCAG